jgi:hypothetical protein
VDPHNNPATHLPHRTFLVVVHDVAPLFLGALRTITRELRRLVNGAIAGAVVPHWHGAAFPDWRPRFAEYVRASFGEVLLHGHTHHAPQSNGLVGLLTDGADEFGALTPVEASQRLRLGRALLVENLGVPVRGFVAPAWQPGPVSPSVLRDCALDYRLGFWGLWPVHSAALPLAVWSWDCGRAAAAGLAGEALGRARLSLRPAAIPCVVLHPRDVARGYLVRALRLIERFLGAGWRPVLPATCLPGGRLALGAR